MIETYVAIWAEAEHIAGNVMAVVARAEWPDVGPFGVRAGGSSESDLAYLAGEAVPLLDLQRHGGVTDQSVARTWAASSRFGH